MKKTVKATASWKGGMRSEAQARNHEVIIDQPEEGGGKDAGANPMEYLLFALGGCLVTMAGIITNQEQIELGRFDVQVEGDYNPGYLLGQTTEGRAGFTEIRIKVNVEADMTDEEKQSFVKRIESRCPISDNLINNTKYVISAQ